MFLFMMRHGQSEGNVRGIAGLDPPMTETGVWQIQLGANRLANLEISHLYCSPLFRALQTAGIVRERTALEPIVDPAFCEIWGDGWNARKKQELQKTYPWANLPETLDGRWWPQIAESPQVIADRAQSAIDVLIRNHGGTEDRVALVGHAMFGSVLLTQWLGIPADRNVFFELRNGSITQIRIENGAGPIVRTVDDVSHLPQSLWT